jgi:hypothetical protein
MAGYEELMGADTWEMVRANVQLRERQAGGGGTSLQRSMRTAPLHDKKSSNFSLRRTRAFVEATLSKVSVNTTPLPPRYKMAAPFYTATPLVLSERHAAALSSRNRIHPA